MYVYFGCICNQKCNGTYGCFENYQSSFLNRASHKAGNSSYFIRFTQYGRRKYYREGGGDVFTNFMAERLQTCTCEKGKRRTVS